jgi:hypothetical protein
MVDFPCSQSLPEAPYTLDKHGCSQPALLWETMMTASCSVDVIDFFGTSCRSLACSRRNGLGRSLPQGDGFTCLVVHVARLNHTTAVCCRTEPADLREELGAKSVVDDLEKNRLGKFTDWAVPGKTMDSAALDLARTLGYF